MGAWSACKGQSNTAPAETPSTTTTSTQIDEYVVDIFKDKKENLWLGTLFKGVGRYDGTSLTYLTTADGLCENTVVAIAEDSTGNMWLGTHAGLSKYDGKTTTNYTRKDGLCNDRVSHILVDRVGNIWIGTWNGVCRFNGITFSDFPLPTPDVEVPGYVATANWVTQIIEDRQGNIWFARSGYGVCKYDGKSFTQFTQKDGLASNCVQAMSEDKQGNIWFGSRVAQRDNADPNGRTGEGGLSRYNGKSFVQYPDHEGLNKNDIYAILTDKKGNVWIGANGLGLYRYDGQSFTLFKGTDRMDLTTGIGVQSIQEDKNGDIWLGLSGGLFRLKDGSIVNVTEESLRK